MPQSKIIMYSANWCGDCRRSKRLMDELNVAYTIIDIENDRVAADKVEEINGGAQVIPVIVFADGIRLRSTWCTRLPVETREPCPCPS